MKEWRSRYLEGMSIWHRTFDTLVTNTALNLGQLSRFAEAKEECPV